jgi:RNA polymerase-binding transcription factor DksA
MQNDAAVLIEQRLAKMQDELVTLLKTHLGDDPTHPLISRLTQQLPNVESLVADLSQEMNLTVYERELAQINDIAAARARIREGTFGICANCKSPINRKRLDAYPTAKRCLPCQALQEKKLPKLPGTPTLRRVR